MLERATLLEDFVTYLRARELPEQFIALYRTAAERFLAERPAYPFVPLRLTHIDHYLGELKSRGVQPRAIANLRIACEAFVRFSNTGRATSERTPPRPQVAKAPIAKTIAKPPTPRKDVGSKGRRKYPRVLVVLDVEIPRIGRVRASDLSVGGIYIETMQAIALGRLLPLHFQLPDGIDELIHVRAKLHRGQAGLGYGCSFADLTENDRLRIEAFIDGRPFAS